MYSVDGGPLQTWDAQHQTLSLSVGPHTFVLAPIHESQRFQRTEWVEQIAAGNDALVLHHHINERAAPSNVVLTRCWAATRLWRGARRRRLRAGWATHWWLRY